jgi:proteasome accessory factor C
MAPERTTGRGAAAATAEAQLERILYILPAAARPAGIRVDELAHVLGVEPAVVLRDLEEATARAFHHPGGFTEPFDIRIEGRRVRVEHRSPDFQRPVRLHAREALALGLGLRVLAADADDARSTHIIELARRLEAELTAAPRVAAQTPAGRASAVARTPETSVEYDEEADLILALGDDGFRGVVADAVELRRTCRILYLRPGDTAPAYRDIAAYRLVYAEGFWYVVARDLDREGLRFFRMDRILDAALTDSAGPPPPADLAEFLDRTTPFVAQDDIEVVVRYSPRISPWVAERTAARPQPDGSVVLRHRVADPRWIVRHVLQYGGDAEVLDPAQARAWVAAAAVRMAGLADTSMDPGAAPAGA